MMASPLAAGSSRASTPESPLAKAATTIDDLTAALSNFSRTPTPDPVIVCCCRREDCESSRAWVSCRAKLESRLVLSAEVGQALLQRHEAHVRRQDAAFSGKAISLDVDDASSRQQVELLTRKLDTIMEENTLMESRINELLIKNEMSDASNKTILRELQEARAAHKRISAQHTRSIGWEMRLAQQAQEKEDMRQERDSQCHRAKVAESKAAAFVEKCSKLQNEVLALREEVQGFRASRAEFSKTVLQEARTRLEALQHSLGRDHAPDDPETTRVLESLVADNEVLKRDVAELQNLLVVAREDVRTLRDELEDHRAMAPAIDDITKVGTPPHSAIYLPRSPAYGRPRAYHPSGSMASGAEILFGFPHSPMQHASPHMSPSNIRHHRRSLSGSTRILGEDAIAEWRDAQHGSLLSPAILNTPPRHGVDVDFESQRTPSPLSLDKYRPTSKSYLLSTRSRGVQTDPPPHVSLTPGLVSPRSSTLGVDRDGGSSTHAHESRSDTSSISQDVRASGTGTGPSAVAGIIEKVSALLVKMSQADVRTLTNRLKRQHLLPSGGDARHLSHSTISGIVNEVANLRPPPSGGGRDDPASNVWTVTRGEIKALLKLFKDTFTELGTLREQINEVVFDPSVAHKIRKEATDPERTLGEQRSASAMGGWIAPIQKLFTNPPVPSLPIPSSSELPSGTALNSGAGANKPNLDVGRGRASAAPRVAPKLAPAISASSTTVNVEFASTGVRKTDTSDSGVLSVSSSAGGGGDSGGAPSGPHVHVTGPSDMLRQPVPLPASASWNLMGIFAGAPRSVAISPPPGMQWQTRGPASIARLRGALPPLDSHNRIASANANTNARANNTSATATIGRSATTRHMMNKKLSRNVDAVIDQKEEQVQVPLRRRPAGQADFHATLLERTLRPRGLSDSSIHTTFLKDMIESSGTEKHDADGDGHEHRHEHGNGELLLRGGGGAHTDTSSSSTAGSQPSSPPRPIPGGPRHYPVVERDEGGRSPAARLGRHLASWATAAVGGGPFGDVAQTEGLFFGSPREDGVVHHAAWTRRGLEGRDG